MSNPAQMETHTQTCPHCLSAERQVRAGRNRAGTQRYLCRACGLSYTLEPRIPGYEEPARRQALMFYAGGMSMRRAARFVGVNHQSVANWIGAALLLPRPAEGPACPAAHAAVWRRLILQEREWDKPSGRKRKSEGFGSYIDSVTRASKPF